MQAFVGNKAIFQEKLLENIMQQLNILTVRNQEIMERNHKIEI